MRVAVIGGGLFGCTAAIHLARADHEVHLFEKSAELMSGATSVNQFRIHEGYHYPRSPETARECQAGLDAFRAEYGRAITGSGRHYYAIASEGSKTDSNTYLDFLKAYNLPFQERDTFLDKSSIDMSVLVPESRVDPVLLKREVMRKLEGVTVRLGAPAMHEMRMQFDRIVIAAYAGTNRVAAVLRTVMEPFQFEVVEKPVIRLPACMRNISIVVMDGPFCSLDPFGTTGLHVMGHVEHAIHASNVGLFPEVPKYLVSRLERGVIPRPEGTRFGRFIEAGKRFIPMLAEAEHQGSMFTVRAVLPDREHDDARPTMVEQLDEQVVRIFSGKLACAVNAARSVASILQRTDGRAQSAA